MICNKCTKDLDEMDFEVRDGKGTRRKTCKVCRKFKDKKKIYNSSSSQKASLRKYKRKYNNTDDMNNQNSLCAISGKPLYERDDNLQKNKFIYVIDHIIPFARGGIHSITNIRLIHPDADRILNYRNQ